MPGSRAPRPWVLSLAVYIAATAVIARDVVLTPWERIASDPGDPVLNAAILAWNAMRVPWTDAWYQFPIFYPTADALTLSEHLLGISVISSPVFWATGNAIAAYNAAVLLSYPLCGAAMYALVWHLTRSAPAAFLAGLAYAFTPYRVSHLPHVQVLFSCWAPVALLALHRFEEALRLDRHTTAVDRGPWRWLVLFGVCWLLQGASNGYFLVYFSVLVGMWLLWFLAARRRWRALAAALVAMIVSSLPLAPILYRYFVTQPSLGLSRNLGEIASFSADIAAPLCAPALSTIWNWLRVACGPEGELFPGVALLALIVAGWLETRRATAPVAARPPTESHLPRPTAVIETPSRFVRAGVRAALGGAAVFIGVAGSVWLIGPWRLALGPLRASASSADKPLTTAFVLLLVAVAASAWFGRFVKRGTTAGFYGAAALVCWIFSWGPLPRIFGADALYYAPYAWLMQVPGVDGLRAPARFWMMTVLCLVVLMGVLLTPFLQRLRRDRRFVLVAAAAALVLADGWTTMPAAAVPRIGGSVSAVRPGEVVMVVPVGEFERDVATVYAAVLGGWRAVNGFSGYEPTYYEALRTLSRAADPRQFVPFLQREGSLHVINTSSERTVRMTRTPPRADAPPIEEQPLPIAAVSASCSPEGASFVADGNLESRWVCGTQRADHDLVVDLGNERTIHAVTQQLGTAGAFFPRFLDVDTSIDGRRWVEAWTGSPAGMVLESALANPRNARIDVRFPPRRARYVRVRQTGRHDVNLWAIAELDVMEARVR